jgi:hypothetical protein
MKTTIDESILANPSEKEMVEKGIRVLEAELEENGSWLQAEWRRLPDSERGSAFELKLSGQNESMEDRYEPSDFADTERLQRRFRRQTVNLAMKGMKSLGDKLRANLVAVEGV